MTPTMVALAATTPGPTPAAGTASRSEGEDPSASFATMLGAARVGDDASAQPQPRPREDQAPRTGRKPRDRDCAAPSAATVRDEPACEKAAPLDEQLTKEAVPGEPSDVATKPEPPPEKPVEDLANPLAALLPGWSPPAEAAGAPPIPVAATPATVSAEPAGETVAIALEPLARSSRAQAVAVGLPEAAGRDAEVRVGEAVVSAASDLVRTATARPHGGETPAETAIAQRDAVLEATARVAREPERPALPQQASVIGLPSLQGTPNAAPATVSPPPGAVVHAHLSPPLDSPSFAPALATQVRWLVHEGVSQAQLKLHPAEMGPVSVRIVLDGREARIDFGADVAATRQVLEASLPVLAAALDDSGIRMTGGSVRDGQGHPQHGHQPRGAPGGRSAATDPAAGHDTGTATAAAREARGLVDLLA